MRKILSWLFCALINIVLVHGQFSSLNNERTTGVLDTVMLKQLLFNGHRQEAASHLSQYLYSQSMQNRKELAPAWLDLAILLAWTEKVPESLAAYSHYKAASTELPDNPLLKANRLLYQSLCLSYTESINLSYTESINQSADSLIASIAIRPGNDSLNQMILADSYGQLARLNKKTGDLFESSRNFERAINLNRKLKRTEILANDLSNLSYVLSTISSSDSKADSVLKESLEIYDRMDNFQAKAQVLNELGVLSNLRSNFTESLGYFKQSLAEKSKITGLNKQEFIVVINNIGICYQYLGKTDSARFYFSKAVDYAIQSGRNPAPYYANLGAYYGAKDQYNQAIEYFQKALNSLDASCSLTDYSTNPPISKTTPDLADFTAFKAHSYHRRYNIFHNPDDLKDGLNTFMVALEMMDTLRFMYSFESKPHLSSEAKIHYFNALDMAIDLYDATGDKKYLDQGFQLSERNKSATLNEFLRTNQALDYMGTLAPWIVHEDSIKQRISKIKSGIISKAGISNYREDSLLSALTDELKNIGIQAKRENPEYFKLVYSNQGYRPETIQKLIKPDEAMIDYTVVHDNRLSLDYMIVMVLTRDTLYTFRDTLPGQFRKDINAFRSTITSYVDAKVFQEFSRLSNLMYRYFFEPVEKFRGIKKLILLPDEELGFLPFEVFVSDTIKPKGSDFRKLSYLNRKYEISYISSHEQFYQFRINPAKGVSNTVYAFAPFISSGIRLDTLNLLSLENSGEEIKSIAKYFRTRVFKNKKAGEPTLRRALQKKSVIILSTHGIMNIRHPMESRLLLNPGQADGSLYLFEMLSIKIRSALVILDACNTGMGKLQVGEGIMSMARGFQFAGVPTVITTLWTIDDQSSATVMKYFFKNLHNGMEQGEALMRARNSYIDQSAKANGAPYFWAGQVLIGDPGSIAIKPRTSTLVLISVLIVTILSLFVIIYKRRR